MTAVTTRGFSVSDRYAQLSGRAYLTGIQALTRVVIDRARLDRQLGRDIRGYVSGYEGSPLAGYDLELIRQRGILDELGIVHEPGLNEELAATAIAGTQVARSTATLTCEGVTGYWYGKSPGLDRATDALRHANLIGTDGRGGAVAFVGDDPEAKSSSVPGSSEYALADLAIPTFVPADPGEILAFGLHAVELSRASGLWSALRLATVVADAGGTVTVSPDWQAPDLTDLPNGLAAYSHQPDAHLLGATLTALERSFAQVRFPIALEYIRRSGVNRIIGGDRDRLGIVSAGPTYLALRQALDRLGLGAEALRERGIRLLKLGVPYPLDPAVVREFAEGLESILVVEDKRAFIEEAVVASLYGRSSAPSVYGKRMAGDAPLFMSVGELDAEAIARGARTFLSRAGVEGLIPPVVSREPLTLQVASRTPHFCSGCPHNSSTVVPAGMLVGAGIGCHAMLLLMPGERSGTITGMTQMGGEGAHWLGMSSFVRESHYVQNMGDGTFAHSGSLAIRAAVAAGASVTFKLLRNSTVAMTGGQSAVGERTLAQLVALLRAEGVARIVVTTEDVARTRRQLGRETQVRHREDLEAVQRELADIEGVTVLIHDQECAIEQRRKRKRGKIPAPTQRIMINERVCEGCGDCGVESNCLSVQPVATDFGRKTRINQSSCNLDFSCVQGDCPSFVTVEPGEARKRPIPELAEPVDPILQVPEEGFAMRITGIGGTGIVTVSQILATAATLAGRHVRVLDQTGLAQKGGPVVSDLFFSLEELVRSPKLSTGDCDLYLACDELVAAEQRYLKVVGEHRTVAVISTSEVATGAMVVDPRVAFPSQARVASAFDGRVRRVALLDSISLATEHLGGEQFANMVMVGAAYQSGALPIRAEHIEDAIRLNGVAVPANIAAFRLGRHAITGSLGIVTSAAEDDVDALGVVELIEVRALDLAAYQDRAYAERYRRLLARVHETETTMRGSDGFTVVVAKNLYKLMAYKDEYEVARLSVDPAFLAEIESTFGSGTTFRYQLHPPALRALGVERKMSLGPWVRPVLRGLVRMRRLRGTVWDPFGRAEVRRVERGLVREYIEVLEELLSALSPHTHELASKIAGLPDIVRGYEEIKLRNVTDYRERLSALLQEFRSLTASDALVPGAGMSLNRHSGRRS